ncbi:MAG: sodium:solute symporter family protein [Bacteroidota bacterium]
MILSNLDWAIIAAFFAVSLITGLLVSKRAGSNTTEFFLSGRNMPWWLLGISMVATTFSTDTPNLVADLVRQNGVSGNWVWWAFLLTGMLTVFVYAKLWRRSQVMTDIEFYELRYSGPAARFLRGFRALYLGLIFNTLVIGSVALAAVKFGEVVLGIPGWQILLVAGSITLVYSAMGGLKAVIITDFILFILAMIGSVWAAIYILNLDQVGGLDSLLAQPAVQAKMDILPDFSDHSIWIPLLFVPLAVQWWASYYPGAEPGGGGYIAQRMFSAKDERNAIGATLLFNIAHYALRPWPWILIALASIVVFPEVADIQSAFPNLSEDKLGNDVAYPAMLTFLPSGLLGLVAASLIAAFMSTMSTQLNLGASYLVNDFYKRFIKPEASEKELVWAGRLFTVVSTVLGLALGLMLTNAAQAFDLLLLLGAGTGAIYLLRWFWWRINAYTEIVAMIASLVIAGYLTFVHDKLGLFELAGWEKVIYGAILTTATWVVATFYTPPDDDETLRTFYAKIRPGGPGWNAVIEKAEKEGVSIKRHPGQLPLEILSMFVGVFTVYAALFATGFWIYGETSNGILFTCLTILGAALLFRNFNRIEADTEE